MKAVILLAGQGRRIQKEYGGLHKAMIPLHGRPLLYYLIGNLIQAGIEEIIPVVGYRGEELLELIDKTVREEKQQITVTPAWNHEYDTTNNLYSLVQAAPLLEQEEFILVNGDMVFDYRLVVNLLKVQEAAIIVDNGSYQEQLDSPRVLIRDGRILDLGRHMRIEEANGYAAGIYRFSKELSKVFFPLSRTLLEKNANLGFHDPLCSLFDKIKIIASDTKNYLWMDVDEKADVEKAEGYLKLMGRV